MEALCAHMRAHSISAHLCAICALGRMKGLKLLNYPQAAVGKQLFSNIG